MMKYEAVILKFKRLLIFAGCFNIIASVFFILPFTCKFYYAVINYLNEFFKLGGNKLIFSNDINGLIVNSFGIIAVLLGIILLICAKSPVEYSYIPLANSFARILFFILVVYYHVNYQIIGFFMIFGLLDIIIGILIIVNFIQLRITKNIRKLII